MDNEGRVSVDVTVVCLTSSALGCLPNAAVLHEFDPPRPGRDEVAGVRRLVVRPATAVTGAHRFSISSPLTPAPGDRVGRAEIVLEQADLEEHLLVLPTRSDSQPIAGETGLAEFRSREVSCRPGAARCGRCVSVDQGPFEAILRPPGEPRRSDLLDVCLAWQIEGRCSAWRLRPGSAGMTAVPSVCRAGFELVHVGVAECATTPVRVGQDRWLVRLGLKGCPKGWRSCFGAQGPPGPTPAGRLSLVPRHATRATVDEPDRMGPVRQTLGRFLSLPLPARRARKSWKVSALQPFGVGLGSLPKAWGVVIEAAGRASPEEPEETTTWYRSVGCVVASPRARRGWPPTATGRADRGRRSRQAELQSVAEATG